MVEVDVPLCPNVDDAPHHLESCCKQSKVVPVPLILNYPTIPENNH